MRVFSERTGRAVDLDSSRIVGKGGEATVYPVQHQSDRLAKIYHLPSRERGEKLRLMLQRPPRDEARSTGRVSIAWPDDILVDAAGQVVGFAMPAVSGSHRLAEIYNPRTRAQTLNTVNDLRFVLRAARNLAGTVASVHQSGYVIGDFNDLNVLITNKALVSLIDCDSFQVGPYRCGVGRLEYLAPELHGANLADIDRNADQDSFSLAIAIHQLMMGGFHPYAGIGEPGELPARIVMGLCPYAPSGPRPPRFAPSVDELPPGLRRLFTAAFVAGHADRGSRPTALEWRDELWGAERELAKAAQCGHYHFKHLSECPECRRQAARAGQAARHTRASRPAGTAGATANAQRPRVHRRSPARVKANGRTWLATVAVLLVSAFGLSYLYPLPPLLLPKAPVLEGPYWPSKIPEEAASIGSPGLSNARIRSATEKLPNGAGTQPVPRSGTDIIREIRGSEGVQGYAPPGERNFSNPSVQDPVRVPAAESGSDIIRKIRENSANSGF